jgi:enterochelin esterase-like enzyme
MADQSEIEIGPDYVRAAEFAVRPGVPAGRIHAFTMHSRESKFYPGIRRLENEITRRRDPWGNRIAAAEHEQSEPYPYTRTVWVYVPPHVEADAPFMVIQDGYGYMRIMPPVLDNLIADERIPRLAAIFVDNGGGDAQGSQRGLEYDTLSAHYADFIEAAVIPRVEGECCITLTKNPDRRVAMGASSGAACAFTMAWYRPEFYRRVLGYSCTFVNQQSPPNAETPRGAWEYHATIVPHTERKPIRVWMEVGEKDLHHDDPEESWHNWPLANRRMAEVLKAKGYDYRFTFSRGARHVDPRVLEETLPGALEWVWRGYRAGD